MKIDFGPHTSDVIRLLCSCPIKTISPLTQHHDPGCVLVTRGLDTLDRVVDWAVRETMEAMLVEDSYNERSKALFPELDRTKAEGVTEWIKKEDLVKNQAYRVIGAGLLLGVWRGQNFLGRSFSTRLGMWILLVEKHWDDGGSAKPVVALDLVLEEPLRPSSLIRTLEETEQELGLRPL